MKDIKGQTFLSPYFFNIRNEKKQLNIFLDACKKGETVLDLGAGTQPYKHLVKDRGLRYISIDFEGSQDYIIDLNTGKLPFEDGSIDNIILCQVLEHIFETQHVLREANRVLKKGGKLFVSTPFLFPLHGIPYDFHRYTKYFYESIAKKYDYDIISLTSGVHGRGNILYVVNILIGYYSFFWWYRILIAPLATINNILIVINNYITQFFPNILKFPLRDSMVSDYVVIYKKL